ncbi:hypothetical protein PHMEG_0009466 [Phytophthora megakarya]|uniref:Uncharacterized protein n=1 Tax=Phytophthora megakarya TaxID=4795 RepID=A0A225WHJ3_9STRA|nr:hypothetical protein PHMEG_0009466 [Phytophthora megakarya]
MTKKRMSEIAREEKAAREARAVAQVMTFTARRSAAKKKERERIALEEKQGADARQQALDVPKRKRTKGVSDVEKKQIKQDYGEVDQSGNGTDDKRVGLAVSANSAARQSSVHEVYTTCTYCFMLYTPVLMQFPSQFDWITWPTKRSNLPNRPVER